MMRLLQLSPSQDLLGIHPQVGALDFALAVQAVQAVQLEVEFYGASCTLFDRQSQLLVYVKIYWE